MSTGEDGPSAEKSLGELELELLRWIAQQGPITVGEALEGQKLSTEEMSQLENLISKLESEKEPMPTDGKEKEDHP